MLAGFESQHWAGLLSRLVNVQDLTPVAGADLLDSRHPRVGRLKQLAVLELAALGWAEGRAVVVLPAVVQAARVLQGRSCIWQVRAQ
jgi:hypothetical protein